MGTPRKRRGFCSDIRHSFELIKKIRLAGRGGGGPFSLSAIYWNLPDNILRSGSIFLGQEPLKSPNRFSSFPCYYA